jgi:hypothetical protein
MGYERNYFAGEADTTIDELLLGNRIRNFDDDEPRCAYDCGSNEESDRERGPIRAESP